MYTILLFSQHSNVVMEDELTILSHNTFLRWNYTIKLVETYTVNIKKIANLCNLYNSFLELANMQQLL